VTWWDGAGMTVQPDGDFAPAQDPARSAHAWYDDGDGVGTSRRSGQAELYRGVGLRLNLHAEEPGLIGKARIGGVLIAGGPASGDHPGGGHRDCVLGPIVDHDVDRRSTREWSERGGRSVCSTGSDVGAFALAGPWREGSGHRRPNRQGNQDEQRQQGDAGERDGAGDGLALDGWQSRLIPPGSSSGALPLPLADGLGHLVFEVTHVVEVGDCCPGRFQLSSELKLVWVGF
jgi:hypothetical protein